MSTVDVKLLRTDRIYRQGETVKGVVVVDTHHKQMSHNGIHMRVSGIARLKVPPRSAGLFEAFYSSIKPLELMGCELEIAPEGESVYAGQTELPFEFPLEPLPGQQMFETYHGYWIQTEYTISVEVARGLLKSNLTKEIEFIIEVPTGNNGDDAPSEFTITPASLENVRRSSLSSIPDFKISGKMFRTNCSITKPLTGEVVIEQAATPVKSIELQLVRVETLAYGENETAREATEIQNIQLGDGDVCKNLVIPIYVVFPRLFTCPTMLTENFRVEFECNLIVLFQDGYMVTENFPITVYR